MEPVSYVTISSAASSVYIKVWMLKRLFSTAGTTFFKEEELLAVGDDLSPQRRIEGNIRLKVK